MLISPAGQRPSSATIITGSGTLVAVMEQVAVMSSWVWSEGHTLQFSLTDEAGRPCSTLRDRLQHNRVELHPDMPASEKKMFLRAMASARDRAAVDSMLRKLDEEQRQLAKDGELQLRHARSEVDVAQRGFQQSVVNAFHSMLASRTRYPGVLPSHTRRMQDVNSGELGQLLSNLGPDAGSVLQAHANDAETLVQAIMERCAAIAALARTAPTGEEDAWLQSHVQKPNANLNDELSRVGAGAVAEASSLLAAGYPFKGISGAAGEASRAGSSWRWGLGIGRILGGERSRAWSCEDTQRFLSEWAQGQALQVIREREALLRKEMTTGVLSVSRRLDVQRAELATQLEQRQVKAERSCLAQLEKLVLSPTTGPAGGDDLQVLRVRRCKLEQRSIFQRAASALFSASAGVVEVLQVTADVQQPQEPRQELVVSLLLAPRPEEASPSGTATCQPQVVPAYGKASIPCDWTLLTAGLMNKGRWLVTVANMPSDRTAITIHRLTSGGQHLARVYGRPSRLADFDEATRFLAFYTTRVSKAGESTVYVYRFSDNFTNTEPACPPVELSTLSGSSKLRDMKLLKTQRKLLMLDAGGRVRVYNIQQRAMERETYTAPASAGPPPTSLLTTVTGNFVIVVSANVQATRDGSKPNSRGGSAADESIRITPLAVPGLRALPQVEARHPGGASSFVTFSLGLGEQGAVNQYLGALCADTGALAAHVVKAQGREQAEQIEAVADGSRDGQGGGKNASELCMLEYLFHAYDKFAVEGAAAALEESQQEVAMHIAVLLDHDGSKELPASLLERVGGYVVGIEQRLKTGYKPKVDALQLSRNLVVASSAGVSDAWLAGSDHALPDTRGPLDAACRSWLLSAVEPLQLGTWVKQLICLLPLQIARAEDNVFVLMADGMQLKAHPRSTEEAVGVVSFGLLDAVLDSWRGDVVVVSSMGKQSTGKSYTLNHLFGTSFQISGARCTDGCWMGLCQVGGVLYVILDFEGLGSFERTEQEDMLLAVFNAAISNFTLFKTEFRLDRDLEAMFSRFQSGTGLLKGDERLFKGCFCIVVKDVAERDVEAINQEFHSKIAMITCPRDSVDKNDTPANFISSMFGGEFVIFPFPPLGRPEFYTDFCQLAEAIASRPRHFTSGGGGGFSSFMKHVMAKMAIKDWTTLQGQNVLNRVQHLSKHLDAAIGSGRLDAQVLGMDDESLISLDTGQVVDSPPLRMSAEEMDSSDLVLQTPQVPDTAVVLRGSGVDQEHLILQLLDLFCRDMRPEMDQRRWEKAFVAFVREVVDRRCSRVQQWVDVNLSPFKEAGQLDDCAVRFMDDVAIKLQQLRNEWQLCGGGCSQCFMSCLLPKSHPAAEHTCMGTHACSESCFFCSEAVDDNQPGSPSVHTCAEKMGHGGVHCCKDKPHTCQAPCGMAGSLNCNSMCCKKAGHEHLLGGGGHLCNSPMHLCGAPCSASDCQGKCQINADKVHTVHKCAEVMCLHKCAVKDCTYTCCSRDHFHYTALSQVFKEEQGLEEPSANAEGGSASAGNAPQIINSKLHFCGKEHACPRRCEAEGICRVTVQQISEANEEVFEGRRSTFSYKSLSEANGHREKCAVRVPPYHLEHEGPHIHSLDPRVVHTCNERCRTCNYYCELPIKHAEKHKGAHGNMRNRIWVSTIEDGAVDFGDRKYVAGESTKAEICDMYCRTAGRGHLHDLPCEAGDPEKCTHAHRDGRVHDHNKYFPPLAPRDLLTHKCYSDTVGWNDNCAAVEREEFAKCNRYCDHPQHKEDGQTPSYCEFELWHGEIDGLEAEQRAIEAEGPGKWRWECHIFPCVHNDWDEARRKWAEKQKQREEEKKLKDAAEKRSASVDDGADEVA
eukprot:jgi/Mesvir1/990/Mv17532-RA.1